MQVYVYELREICQYLVCHEEKQDKDVLRLQVLIRDQVLDMTGKDGVFTIPEPLAQAFAAAPIKPTKILLFLKGEDRPITSVVGEQTVKLWSKIYSP